MEIRMARGDLETRTITLKKKDGTAYDVEPDEIYMTVKNSVYTKDFLFQKKLSDGSIIRTDTGKYQFYILPEDTNGLEFKAYDFDIEIVKESTIKKTFTGRLVLEKEVTFACNEG